MHRVLMPARWRALRIACVVGTMCWGAPTSAAPTDEGAAGEARVAVLPLTVTGPLDARYRASFESSVAEGLQRGSFQVIDAGQVRGVASKAETCADRKCLRGLAATTRADYLVRATVTIESRDYDLRMELINGTSGEAVTEAADACEICGEDEVAELIENLSASLRRKLDATVLAAPVLLVKSTPSGAVVTVDGEAVGTTPLEANVDPGKHDVQVVKDGFVAWRERRAFVDGARETVTAELEPVPNMPTTKQDKLMRTLGWTGIGTGVAAIAVGISLMVIDDRPIASDCEGENVNSLGTCKYRYDTMAGGIGAVVAGVALAGGGVALLLVARSRGRNRRVRGFLGPTGGALQVRF